MVRRLHFTYLTTPNPINENVISFMNVLPREFDLHRFIDYDMQFDKAFVDPLKVVISLIGWNVEPVASLDNFFWINSRMAYSKKVVDRFNAVVNNPAHAVGRFDPNDPDVATGMVGGSSMWGCHETRFKTRY